MSTPDTVRSPASTLRRSTLALLAFWLLVAGVLWWGFSWWDGRQRAALQPYQATDGELVIPRGRDGHFYVDGEINHVPVTFLVDTGASSVAVSTRVARAARLPDGRPVTVSTAGGTREARLVHGVPIKAGPLARNDVSVTTGLDMGDGNSALLGQSFLRHFDVRIEGNRMVLHPQGTNNLPP
ncbi:retropepsin-like aspartic protease family protein [Ottowia testudinis]|uniref:TIGR02281 family clan AA aspartic protease n=1 Tax=Ottowia testudinis TaxID=2816950 RepID=A0A975CII2_9BURK|nr:TIGR02281 family clan AA aspartic protease [Ottowia testudinis]QTD44023.1 TIGR02281 family clan AA aspartic protease [Ottowia testudinis]